MRVRDKQSIIERKTKISVYIRETTSDELLEWLNSQKYTGPAILNILEKYVKGQIISIDTIKALNLTKTTVANYQNKVIKPEPIDEKEVELVKSKDSSEEEEEEAEKEVISLGDTESDLDNDFMGEQNNGEDDVGDDTEENFTSITKAKVIENKGVEGKREGQLSTNFDFSGKKPVKSIFKEDK